MWNLPPPPGFGGPHPHQPLTGYVRHLPHWRQKGATYFVTFRLGDGLPQAKLQELEHLQREWELNHPPPRSESLLEQHAHETMRRIEFWLDQGMGSCRLRNLQAAEEVIGAMRYFDGERFELDSYVVIANHVHGIVRPLRCGKTLGADSAELETSFRTRDQSQVRT